MSLTLLINRHPFRLAAISGLLLVLVFPPFGLDWLAWVALVPLMLAVACRDGLTALKAGFICGFISFSGVMMPWIMNVLTVYGHVWYPLAVFLMLLLMAYLALYFALYGWVVSVFGPTPEAVMVSPPLFVLLEYVRSYFLSGLPWALIAHSQAEQPAVIQLSAYAGTAGVTFLVVLVNASIAFLILKRERWKKVIAVPLFAVLLAAANVFWGWHHIRSVEDMGGTDFTADVVQGNIDQGRKWDAAFTEQAISTYYGLTLAEARGKPDLVVWPETAVPFFFDRNMAQRDRLLNFSKEIAAPILFGGMGVERSPETGKTEFFNRAYVIGPAGVKGHYDKMHLVPFGEYVPFHRLLFFVDRITDAVEGDIQAGNSTKPLMVDSIPVGIQICYEIKFPGLTRRFVQNGARLMVNITNDAWFGRSGASAQHMASLPFRAVENRVPIIRAANTGISGFVAATGKIIVKTPLFKKTSLSRKLTIPPYAGTFYTRFGDVFTFLCALALVAAFRASRKGKE